MLADLPITLNSDTHTSIPAQLTDQIRRLITRGILTPGDPLPSTRALATQLGVSRGSIVTAYDQLAGEGYLSTAHGSGTTVNPDLHVLKPVKSERKGASISTPPPLLDLRPGLPDTATLADSAWRSAWREACANPPTRMPAQGLLQLRVEIADHLRQMRGLMVEPEQIIVTAGAREGLSLLLRAMDHFPVKLGVESPGYPSLRRIPQVLGHETIDVRTDESGLVPSDLPSNLHALLITPSHQYPYGGSLPADRRTALVTWAETHDVLLIEDDFDSELRYIGMPLPPLRALAPDRTILLGTFSSVLTPQVACGYLIAPTALAQQLTELRGILGQPVGAITQHALATYLASGALRRRTQRLRRLYRHRRSIVQKTLGDLPTAQLRPINGGLHAVLICEKPQEEITATLTSRGLSVTALSHYWGGDSADNGIVFGFGSHDEDTLEWILAEISDAVSQ